MSKEIKDAVAVLNGYPNWEEMYNWVSRDGQFPAVTAQLIEAAMDEVARQSCEALEARVKELEVCLSDCLDGVIELNGEYQEGWDETIAAAKQLLNPK